MPEPLEITEDHRDHQSIFVEALAGDDVPEDGLGGVAAHHEALGDLAARAALLDLLVAYAEFFLQLDAAAGQEEVVNAHNGHHGANARSVL